MLFRIKICGVTTPDDARMVAEAGADAVGLNFYAKSRRVVAVDRAAEIALAIEGGPLRVGVFVNASAEEVARVVDAVGLDAIQLHGDETPTEAVAMPTKPLIRAFRVGGEGLAEAAAYDAECRKSGRPLAAALVDAASSTGEYGGTGETVDWARIERDRAKLTDTPLILAGGLRAENVAQAVAASRPDGVDTASGVESAPGQKDPELVARFVASAREALGLTA